MQRHDHLSILPTSHSKSGCRTYKCDSPRSETSGFEIAEVSSFDVSFSPNSYSPVGQLRHIIIIVLQDCSKAFNERSGWVRMILPGIFCQMRLLCSPVFQLTFYTIHRNVFESLSNPLWLRYFTRVIDSILLPTLWRVKSVDNVTRCIFSQLFLMDITNPHR